MFFNCLACRKVAPIIGAQEAKCPSCGSTNGELLSHERFNEGFKAGVLFNIDPKTGKPAKKKRRRCRKLTPSPACCHSFARTGAFALCHQVGASSGNCFLSVGKSEQVGSRHSR